MDWRSTHWVWHAHCTWSSCSLFSTKGPKGWKEQRKIKQEGIQQRRGEQKQLLIYNYYGGHDSIVVPAWPLWKWNGKTSCGWCSTPLRPSFWQLLTVPWLDHSLILNLIWKCAKVAKQMQSNSDIDDILISECFQRYHWFWQKRCLPRPTFLAADPALKWFAASPSSSSLKQFWWFAKYKIFEIDHLLLMSWLWRLLEHLWCW